MILVQIHASRGVPRRIVERSLRNDFCHSILRILNEVSREEISKINEKEKKTLFLLLLSKGVSDVHFCTAKNKAGSSKFSCYHLTAVKCTSASSMSCMGVFHMCKSDRDFYLYLTFCF